ncbi:MAG: hypothetical protein ABIG66_02900 [Candidatus Kerfeldbacteria bacterium]|nr:hypothetical protein [Verrucomicrobiota bacterium]
MKKVISIEYCHLYPGKNEKKAIKEANFWMPKILKMFDEKEYVVQKCMMVDDIHPGITVDKDYLVTIADQLDVQPDCIYPESEFFQEANKLIDSIDMKERDFITSDERTFLRESVEKYRSSTEFLISWKNKNGDVEFSLPSLAATSYLTRLGYITADGVVASFGQDMLTADYAVNVLSSSYLQVEDKAQSLVEATFPEAMRKISWFFY